MLLPIAATPTLYGEDAKRFLKEIEKVNNHVPTKEEIEAVGKTYEDYKKIMENFENAKCL